MLMNCLDCEYAVETTSGRVCTFFDHPCDQTIACQRADELPPKRNYPVFTIDKDDDEPMRAFHFAKDLYERIIEAENLAFMNEIKANTVVINGWKYGMLKDKPGFAPTIFGMRAETKANMPDEWDFLLQERPPQPKTNADRLRSMTDGELAAWLFHHSMVCVPGKRPNPGDCVCECEHCWLDWLREEEE